MIMSRKRVNILSLGLFLVSYACKIDGIAPDLTQLVKSDGEIMCFASGNEANSALDWTYPIPEKSEDLPKSGLYYIPRVNSDFNCNFELDSTCSGAWSLINWSISESSEPITDARWEDFKVIHVWNNLHEAIDRKIMVTNALDLGISIRTDNWVTIWLCEGWRPDKYPCLLLKIGFPDKGKVFLGRNDNATEPTSFQRPSDIFSEHEWKHFKLSYNEEHYLELTDINRNEKLAEGNNTVLKPLFLFMTSASPSLWKFHNNRFLYSNVSGVTKFGPPIHAESSIICVSLYVSMCKHCSVNFFVQVNKTKQVVASINFEQRENLPWKNTKIVINDIEQYDVQLYVETISTMDDKFWKIDNVRACYDQEIKITTLSTSKNLPIEKDARISCHTLLSPEWTPNKQRLSSSKDLIVMEHELSPTAIKLSWNETSQVHHTKYYAIKYEGSDLCDSDDQPYKSSKRLKSKGWIVTNQNTAVIKNLIPYTFYSITHQDLVYFQNKTLSLNTISTDKPVLQEIPQNVRIKPLEYNAKVFFDSAMCNATYGPLMYRVTFSNVVLNFTSQFVDAKSDYGVDNLLPFTDYNLTIEVARDVSSLEKPKLKYVRLYNFTTRPAVAFAVKKLEVYETDETSIAIRFDLPQPPTGRPKFVRIQHCHPMYLNDCEFTINNISKCRVWEDKYCSEVKDLIRNHTYWLAVGLKNEDTHIFGREAHVLATTIAKKPSPPVNLTYKVIHYNEKTDYYDLNISWSHPYDQNGTITAFDVFLVEEHEMVGKSIHEVLQIPDKSYQRDYVKSIKFVPYVAKYNISVRAINDKCKSEFVSVEVLTDHFRNYLDQVPTVVNHTSTSVFVNVPALDRRLGTYTLTIVIQNIANKAVVDDEVLLLADDNLCLDNVESWIATVVERRTASDWLQLVIDSAFLREYFSSVTEVPLASRHFKFITGYKFYNLVLEITEDHIPLIEIGDGTEMNSTMLNQTIVNKPLQPNEEYCINFIIKNVYKKTEHVVVYREKYINTVPNFADQSNKPVIIIMLVLTVLAVMILVVLILYKYGKDGICRRRYRQDGEHIYEAMPFDDFSEPNVMYNATYDKLQH